MTYMLIKILRCVGHRLLSYHGGENDLFKLNKFLCGKSVDNPQNIIRNEFIHSRRPYIETVRGIYKILIESLPQGEQRRLEHDPAEEVAGIFVKRELYEMMLTDDERKSFEAIRSADETEDNKGNFTSAPDRVCLPSKFLPHAMRTFLNRFGTPIDKNLREDGVLRSNQLRKNELDALFYHYIDECITVLERLHDLNELGDKPYRYIRALCISVLQVSYFQYSREHHVTQEDVVSTTTMMQQAGYVSDRDKPVFINILLDRKPIPCEICGDWFTPDRPNQKRHSYHDDAKVQRHRRKKKGAGSPGGKRSDAGRKRKTPEENL